MVRLKDNGTRMNIYDQGEMDTAKAAYWEKYGDPTAKENESFSDQYKQALEAQRQGTESIQNRWPNLWRLSRLLKQERAAPALPVEDLLPLLRWRFPKHSLYKSPLDR